MQIKHSDLFNDFISFWFDTSVDGAVKYRTWLDFLNLVWSTELITKEEEIFSGKMHPYKGVDAEAVEIERIKNLVTEKLA